MVKETSEVGLSGLQSSPVEWVENGSPGLWIVPENAMGRGMMAGDLGKRPHPFQIAPSSLSVGGIYQGLTPPQL
ncbi:hypothetical protein NG799_16790 [Laspinema sp. D1]|uniref:Uncharacterized protein n=1 Tax=Laspinema palackyanum D2a TaxID=2953684 RepID=A0ABT2MT93_9CYAN|nr:hypothetical protein [Laspinema sp. D2a]